MTDASAACAAAPYFSVDAHELGLAGLIRRAANGEVEAMDVFHDLTCDSAYGLTCRLLGAGGEAESLLCDAYLAAWCTIRVAPPEPGAEISWLLAKVLEQYRAVGTANP